MTETYKWTTPKGAKIYRYQTLEDLERGYYGATLYHPGVTRPLYDLAEYALPDWACLANGKDGILRIYDEYDLPCDFEATAKNIYLCSRGRKVALEKIQDIEPQLTEIVFPI